MITIILDIQFFLVLSIVGTLIYTYTLQKKISLYDHVEGKVIAMVGHFVCTLLAVPEVNDSLTKLIAGGINAWLIDPVGQQYVSDLLLNGHEAAATELGKNFPKFVGKFTSGMIRGTFSKQKSNSSKDTKLPSSSSSRDIFEETDETVA